jgi:hypothetical protein
LSKKEKIMGNTKNSKGRTLTPEEIKECKTKYTPPLTREQIAEKKLLDAILPDASTPAI